MKNVLLLGRTAIVVDSARDQVRPQGVELYTGNNLEEARTVDTVIMGAGLDLADRLKIVEFVCSTSASTTVHLKDKGSRADGCLPYMLGVLRGLFGPAA